MIFSLVVLAVENFFSFSSLGGEFFLKNQLFDVFMPFLPPMYMLSRRTERAVRAEPNTFELCRVAREEEQSSNKGNKGNIFSHAKTEVSALSVNFFYLITLPLSLL